MLTRFNNPLDFFAVLISFLVAIAVHEAAHAFLSDRMGDPTARLAGRLTLNPFKHLDWLGTLMILFAPFGWAKPVEVDSFNLRNPRRDMALISLAGPAANILTAIIFSLILRSFTLLPQTFVIAILSYLVTAITIMNVNLAIFNLIPIHPFDGFAVVAGLLPENAAHQWMSLRPLGIFMILILVLPIFGSSPVLAFISPIIQTILSLLLP
jgi:Zn-dependent protease